MSRSASFSKSASQLMAELTGSPVGSPAQSPSTQNPSASRKRKLLVSAKEVQDYQDNFTKRLASFDEFRTWQLKLGGISPWELARRGWVCVEDEMAQCVGCSAHLSLHLPSSTASATFRRCVDSVKEAMVSRHGTACAWRSQPTAEADLLPPVLDHREAVATFQARAAKWEAHPNVRLPSNAYVLNDVGVPAAQVATLFKIAPSDASDLLRVSYLSTGWEPTRPTGNSIHCSLCLRSLPLVAFDAKAQEKEAKEAKESPPDPKRPRLLLLNGPDGPKRVLHPLKQHQPWCPWLHAPATASAVSDPADGRPGPQPLWRLFVDALSKPALLPDAKDSAEAPTDEAPAPTEASIASAVTQARQLIREGLVRDDADQTPAGDLSAVPVPEPVPAAEELAQAGEAEPAPEEPPHIDEAQPTAEEPSQTIEAAQPSEAAQPQEQAVDMDTTGQLDAVTDSAKPVEPLHASEEPPPAPVAEATMSDVTAELSSEAVALEPEQKQPEVIQLSSSESQGAEAAETMESRVADESQSVQAADSVNITFAFPTPSEKLAPEAFEAETTAEPLPVCSDSTQEVSGAAEMEGEMELPPAPTEAAEAKDAAAEVPEEEEEVVDEDEVVEDDAEDGGQEESADEVVAEDGADSLHLPDQASRDSEVGADEAVGEEREAMAVPVLPEESRSGFSAVSAGTSELGSSSQGVVSSEASVAEGSASLESLPSAEGRFEALISTSSETNDSSAPDSAAQAHEVGEAGEAGGERASEVMELQLVDSEEELGEAAAEAGEAEAEQSSSLAEVGGGDVVEMGAAGGLELLGDQPQPDQTEQADQPHSDVILLDEDDDGPTVHSGHSLFGQPQ